MPKKSRYSHEALNRMNERRRTCNAFKALNSLLIEYMLPIMWGGPQCRLISPDEAKKYLRAIFFHYCGRIDPERSKMWIDSIKRISGLMDDDYIPGTPHARELITIHNDICDVLRELETGRKAGRPKKKDTE